MKRPLLIFYCLSTCYSFASGQQARDNQPAFLIKPFLQYSTQTEMSMLWETTHPTTSLIEFGKAGFDTGKAILSQHDSDGELKLMHEITMESLEPETNYFYRVISVTATGGTL